MSIQRIATIYHPTNHSSISLFIQINSNTMASLRLHKSTPHHFLIVTTAIQGQINPARHLARRLARATTSRVTLAIPVSSHRRLFPSKYQEQQPQQVIIVDEAQPLVSYAAYSDGNEDGSLHLDVANASQVIAQLKLVGSETLTCLVRSLATDGRQVTCVLYTILTAWAANVAWEVLGVPSVLYWIQPAAVLSIFYHYFHGYADIVTAHRNDQDPSFVLKLPGLPPLRINNLPSMLADPDSPFLEGFHDIMKALQQTKERSTAKPTVLLNTFHELEAKAIEALDDLNLISVGPIIEKDDQAIGSNSKDLFEQDKSAYMEWLDSKERGSVVYISFGSLSMFSRTQMEEMSKGLAESGRPYLWVVRRDVREKEGNEFVDQLANNGEGMVIEWCDQVRVLSHCSVGCFVTHSGWNSTMESIVGGVPMVMLPQWADQATNAKMVEEEWRTGVKAEANSEGVMEATELKRCLGLVMGEGGAEIRRNAEMWREKASTAVEDDGPSVRSLIAFVDGISIGIGRSSS